MATCVWMPCEEREETEEDGAVIVRFSNGHVKNTDQLDFKLFRHVDGVNPRKKTRRIVAAESDRLAYVGSNFGPGSLQCNNLCRYFVGVLDKQTMEMKVQRAQIFTLQPSIPGETVVNDDKNETKSYRQKVDDLIEAFGTTRQKRALSSRRLNEVGNETLRKAVDRAAGNVIDQKGLEVLQQEVADSEAQTEVALFLPPFNKNADKREDVYPFSGLLSPNELNALKQIGERMVGLTSEDLLKMRKDSSPETVLRLLEHLPKDPEARNRQACCAWYLLFLIRLAQQKKLYYKHLNPVQHLLDVLDQLVQAMVARPHNLQDLKDVLLMPLYQISQGTFKCLVEFMAVAEDDCPRLIYNKVRKIFTVEMFAKGRVRSTVSASMQVKLASHCLALLLHMGDQTANLTLLHRDLNISERKMLEVAKAMGLTLSRPQEEHRTAFLELPLVRYDHHPEERKRKKMQ